MSNAYGGAAPVATQPSAGDQRNRLAALLMERQMGGPPGAPAPGVPSMSAQTPTPGSSQAAAPGQRPAMPIMPQGQPAAAGMMPPPTGAMGPIGGPAALPLPGTTPGGGAPGQPLPLKY